MDTPLRTKQAIGNCDPPAELNHPKEVSSKPNQPQLICLLVCILIVFVSVYCMCVFVCMRTLLFTSGKLKLVMYPRLAPTAHGLLALGYIITKYNETFLQKHGCTAYGDGEQ